MVDLADKDKIENFAKELALALMDEVTSNKNYTQKSLDLLIRAEEELCLLKEFQEIERCHRDGN